MYKAAIFLALLAFSLAGCTGRVAQPLPETNSDNIRFTQDNSIQASPEVSSVTGSTYTANGVEAKVGIISTMKDSEVCVRGLNAQLKHGNEIYLIIPYEKPHKLLRTSIVRKLATSCVDDDSDIGDSEMTSKMSYYLAKVVETPDEFQILSGFAILDPSISPKLENGIARAELTGTPPDEYFRECTSNEGMHFTVWNGKPLVGKRIWHRYYYLHYGTEPTCKKKDYEDTDE